MPASLSHRGGGDAVHVGTPDLATHASPSGLTPLRPDLQLTYPDLLPAPCIWCISAVFADVFGTACAAHRVMTWPDLLAWTRLLARFSVGHQPAAVFVAPF